MKYVPTSFFKTLRNEYLKPIFDQNNIELEGVDWTNRVAGKDKTVAEAWSNLHLTQSGKKAVAEVHEVFQCISALAKPTAEANTFIHILESQGRLRETLPKDFDELNRQEQVAHIYLKEGKKTLLTLMDMSYAHDMTHQTRWTEFENAPILPGFKVTKKMKDEIAASVDAAFIAEKKGGHCKVETYPMDEGVIYFLCKLDDKPEFYEMKKPGDKDYGYLPVIRPFTVTLAYDYNKGIFSMHAVLSAKKVCRLAQELINVITGKLAPLEPLGRPTYDLSVFEKMDYKPPTLPEYGCPEIHVRTLVIVPDVVQGSEVVFKNKEGRSAYDTMGEYHQRHQLPEGTFTVVRVAITIEFSDPETKKINFELSPKKCTQTGLLDSQRKIVEALIDKMGVRRHQ